MKTAVQFITNELRNIGLVPSQSDNDREILFHTCKNINVIYYLITGDKTPCFNDSLAKPQLQSQFYLNYLKNGFPLKMDWTGILIFSKPIYFL